MNLHDFDLLVTKKKKKKLQCASTNLKVQMLSDEMENC